MLRPIRLFFFLGAFLPTLESFSQNLDINILKGINKNSSTLKTKYLEMNASSVSRISIGVPVGIALAGFIRHDKKLKRDALYMGVSYLTNALITESMKRIIDRQRPFEKYPFIIKRDDESGGLSFPSGHTSSAFCIATDVSLRYRKWYFVVPAYVFAGSVAWARMYQGVHYPSDVLAGALIGSGSAWLGWKIQKWMEKRHKK